MNQKSEYIYDTLEQLFPDAHCELNYNTVFQLAVAVILSAQTTDVSVNRVTPVLFEKYPDCESLANADAEDVEEIIRSIGLYRNKARSIIKMAQEVQKSYQGRIPDEIDDLVRLPGIGRKTANVIVSEGFRKPGLAVDTHVHRVSWRLDMTEESDSPEQVEKKLKDAFPEERWGSLHHLMIFFGRYMCHSQKPDCAQCPFLETICVYNKKKVNQ